MMPPDASRTPVLPALWGYAALLIVVGLAVTPAGQLGRGLVQIVRTEDALITDYMLVAGTGPALVNAGLVTAISIAILRYAHAPFDGSALVVVGLMSGFALFGKNYLNLWPILLGARLYAWYRGEPFGRYAAAGLTATALAPVVSYFVLDNGWGTLPAGILAGVAIGFLLPALAAHTYRIQRGMNLYNMGFACGLAAFLIVPLMNALGAAPTVQYRWSSGRPLPVLLLSFGLCAALLLIGLFLCGQTPNAALCGYRALLRTSGRAPSDYLTRFGPAPTLVNMGVNGLIALVFLLCTGGDLNGPTLGAILTILGFSAYGKHARNMLPVMGGVVLGSAFMHWSLSNSAVQLAGLFCTALAPVSGCFGWPYGILAGFLHASVVLCTSSPVAGMNLYNNGFSAGLVAIVLSAVIPSLRRPT